MAERQFYYVLFHLFCVQNVFGQLSPYANLLAQNNIGSQPVINFQQPIPAYNRNNGPLNIIKQLASQLAILYNLQSRNVPTVNNLPVINSFPINTVPNNNVPIVSPLNRLPINVPSVSPINILPYNNLPIGKNVPIVNQINSLPFGTLPTVNRLPLTTLPNINTLPFANSFPLNNIAFNNLPVSNSPINNVPPYFNNLALINKLPLPSIQPTNNPSVLNNLPISTNYNLLTNLPNVNQIPIPNSLPLMNNIPANILLNNLPNYYNLFNNNPRVNNYPVPNINTNVPNLNYLPVNNLPVGQTYNFANLPFLNNGVQVSSPQRFVRQNAQSIPVANDCNCNQVGLSLVENKLTSLPSSEPLVSLNGLQLGGLGGLGNLPLFNGLPVIGVTESVVNLKPCNCQS